MVKSAPSERMPAAGRSTGIPRQPAKPHYCLSRSQEDVWLDHELNPNSCAHNELFTLLIDGNLDVPALQRSLESIIERHDAVRATFLEIDGHPVQKILAKLCVLIPVIELTDLSSETQPQSRVGVEYAMLWTAFKVATGPLIRIVLLKLADDRYELIVVVHHLICDGLSFQILMRDIAALYTAVHNGTQVPPQNAQISYVDFAEWDYYSRRKALDDSRLVGKAGLRQSSPPLLADFSPNADSRGAWQEFIISGYNLESLKKIARSQNTTLSNVLLAMLHVLLFKFTSQRDLSIGLVVANRIDRATERIIGLFADVVAVQLQLVYDPSFTNVLQQVTKEVFEAYSRRMLAPVEIEGLNGSLSLLHEPIFRVAWSYQPAVNGPWHFGGLKVYPGEAPSEISTSLDLRCLVQESPDTVRMRLVYRKTLYRKDTIHRLLGAWQRLIGEIVEVPTKKISQLEVMSEAERQQLLLKWSVGGCLRSSGLIHEMISERAQSRPAAIAITSEQQHLTYGQLDRDSNQLALYLRGIGVGAEVCVGVFQEHTAELIVSILGILKAGGAFLPLDPTYPVERIAFMLGDAQPGVILTTSKTSRRLPSTLAQVICLDTERNEIDEWRGEYKAAPISPDNLAYVMYTSGSSGRPKRVGVSHRGIGNLALHQREAFAVNTNSVLLQFSSLSFDAAVSEWSTSLSAGARLVMVSRKRLMPGQELLELLELEEVTTLTLPPSVLAVLQERPLLCLETLVVAGEACSRDLVERWSGGRRMLNAYGPTEGTVCASISPPLQADDTPVIGQPIANVCVYVLDEWMKPRSVGSPGEIYIAGLGLARGYLGLPALTAEKFVPNPFSAIDGDRLYRTGDWAKWRFDGQLEFLGRLDEQVKIRGFRIELGEIEAALLEHPAVQQAVACAHADERNDALSKRLIAYVVPSAEIADSREIRKWLQTRLPDYMVPGGFVFLDRMPLTPNGKIDYISLRNHASTRSQGNSLAAPVSQIEEMLSIVWAEVLKLERVGREDNFFELGGHSLMATQVVSRVRSLFKVDLPLLTLFEAPVLSAFAGRVEMALSDGTPLQVKPIARVPRDEELPLSFAQQRLWFLHQLDPENVAYNMPIALRLIGDVDQSALEKSFHELIRRHEILRTCFPFRNDTPLQEIACELKINIENIDLRALPPEERETTAQKVARADATTPFDLAKLPLLRVKLLWLAQREYVLFLNTHHIVTDAWSAAIMIREIRHSYYAFSCGHSISIEELKIQYVDFAAWQRQMLTGSILDELVAYWKKQLNGIAALDLPTDRQRPATMRYQGANTRLAVPGTLVDKLRELARSQEATLYMVLLATFQALLNRYSGQSDITVGSPIAGRRLHELEKLIGFFVNTLVMRATLTPEMSFRDLVRQVKDTTLEAHRYQDLPFDRLVEILQPDRHLSHTPIFHVMFALQNAEQEQLQLPGLDLRPFDLGSTTAVKFDLLLDLIDDKAGLQGELSYSTELFDHSTINLLIEHYLTLLESIVEKPDQRISRISLLNTVERRQVVELWNDTEIAFAAGETIPHLIEAQVLRTPNAVAVIAGQIHLTYLELNEKSNRLGNYLISLGIKPESRVGVYLERSAEMVISLLAILKAGGVYVPLDRDNPPERLRYLVNDARIGIVVTDSKLAGHFPSSGVKCVRVDLDTEEFMKCLPSNPEGVIDKDSLAYVIYTSGSTGRPKGAMNSHKGVCNRLQWMPAEYQMQSSEVFLQKTPFSFDVSVWEIFTPLIMGAKLVLATPGGHRDPFYLAEVIANEKISTIHFVPSMLAAFLGSGAALHCGGSLKRIMCSGEALTLPLAKACLTSLPIQLNNLYGPTETGIEVSYWKCSSKEGDLKRVTIGRPIANTRLYVLGEELEPVPVGVRGELYIGGRGVGRGYLNQPGLTAEKFVPNPFCGRGERMYRTGDLVRWLADGTVEFLGRIDQQVKIRGNRIELQEIETVLREHAIVQQAAVAVEKHMSGSDALVAYIETSRGIEADADDLREWLTERLPEYMVPWRFVIVDQLPKLSSGKIDRTVLQTIAKEATSHERRHVLPLTETEAELIKIWQGVLGQQSIGADDNFFELGGDSILSIQASAKAKQAGLAVTVRQMFQYQTIRELARVVKPEIPVETAEERRYDRSGDVPLTPIQHWCFEQETERPKHFNQGLLLAGIGPIHGRWLEIALESVVGTHDALRLRFHWEAGEWKQSYAEKGARLHTFSMIDLSELATTSERTVIETAAGSLQQSFCLEEGPLVRAACFKLQNGETRLLLIIHHLIVDGVSWRILLDQLQDAYRSIERGLPWIAPRRGSSYQHWATALAAYARSDEVRREQKYWTRSISVETIPRDYVNGANTVASASSIEGTLNVEETRQLLEHGAKIYKIRMHDIFLAAVARTIATWSGQEWALLDVEAHGREEDIVGVQDISRTVGWFTAIYPVLLQVGNKEFARQLKTVRDQLREIPRKGLGYGLLRYLSGDAEIVRRIQQRQPAEVLFNYEGQVDQILGDHALFREADEPIGMALDPRGKRSHLIETSIRLTKSQLRCCWRFSKNVHQSQTIEKLSESLLSGLKEIIAGYDQSQETTHMGLSGLEWQKVLEQVSVHQP